MINNYIRNRTGDFFGFDDQDPDQIVQANLRVRAFSGKKGTLADGKEVDGPRNPAAAWRRARGLYPDAYVGAEKTSGL